LPLFNRTASVLIGAPNNEEGLGIRGLRIVFNVKKTRQHNQKATNTCKLEIYNLAPTSRSKINSTNDVVVVRAGYTQDQGESIIFRGDITNVNHLKQMPDVVSVIESDDGVNAMQSVKLAISYKEGTSLLSILNDLVKKFPLAKNIRSVLAIPDVKINKGFQGVGFGKDMLDKITLDLGLEWSVQDQTIKLIEKDGQDSARVLHISPTSGLIGSPVKKVDVIKKSVQAGRATDRPGWVVKSLLQPTAEPGSPVSIESSDIPRGSVFIIENVEHKGDTAGGDFITELDVVEAK